MSTARFTEILTRRLRIRRFRPDDLPAIYAYRNDPEVARFQGWTARTEEELREFVAYMAAASPGEPGSFQFAVARREDDALIGDVYMRIHEHDPRQAEIGYSLARAWQGQGYASEAVTAVLGYAFENLGLHRVFALVECENTPSVALLERVGMRREGHFRQHFFARGAYRDEYQYALLGAEWPVAGEVGR